MPTWNCSVNSIFPIKKFNMYGEFFQDYFSPPQQLSRNVGNVILHSMQGTHSNQLRWEYPPSVCEWRTHHLWLKEVPIFKTHGQGSLIDSECPTTYECKWDILFFPSILTRSTNSDLQKKTQKLDLPQHHNVTWQ